MAVVPLRWLYFAILLYFICNFGPGSYSCYSIKALDHS